MPATAEKKPTRAGASSRRARSSAPEPLEALLAVARAVSHGRKLETVLNRIAREAATVVDAKAASILLIRVPRQPFQVAGAHNLGPTYRHGIENPTRRAFVSDGPAFLATENNRQIVIEDTLADSRYSPWQRLAEEEGYRSIVSTPLVASDRTVIGTLDVYRSTAGSWSRERLKMLALFAQHGGMAVQTARLIDRQRHQLGALGRVVGALREQSHEHANRVHTIAGLLAIEEYEAAARFLESLERTRRTEFESVIDQIRQPVVCGLLVAQMRAAEQRGIRLRLTPATELQSLPPGVDEASGVTILGNLLDNAFDAVAGAEARRREVTVSFTRTARNERWRVRDRGRGIPDGAVDQLLRRGYSKKRAHRGLGLYLVADTVERARGRLDVKSHAEGTTFQVSFPREPGRGI